MDLLNAFGPSPDSGSSDMYLQSSSANTNSHHHIQVIVSSLQIASQLARNSEKYFPQLLSVLTPAKLVYLLSMVSKCELNILLTLTVFISLSIKDNAVVRAKTCNLVGNICR